MLVGSYKNTIDTKGRVFLPAKFRSYLGERIIIVKGAEGCLVVYTEEKYMEYIDRLRKNGETVTTKDFLRIGVPFTLAAVICGYAFIWLFWGI